MFTDWNTTTGWVLHWLVAFFLVASGLVKALGPTQAIAANFSKWHLVKFMRWIGLGETVAGALLAIPITSPLGVLAVSANWGGAITVHMSHDESFAAPAVFLFLTWAGVVLKAPALIGL